MDNPEDWPHLFAQHLNAGDLEAVLALYQADARFVTRSGDIIVGRESIGHVLGPLIDRNTRFQSRGARRRHRAVVHRLEGTTADASGQMAGIRHKAIEVVRRQPDGTWKLIVGNPDGRDNR